MDISGRECEGLVVCRGCCLGGGVAEASTKVVKLVQEGDVTGCGDGVAGFIVSDGLDALPHASGVGVGEVTLYLQLVVVLGLFDAPSLGLLCMC